MTYQGERARPMPSESGRFFEVSKVRIGADGHVSDVLWSEVDASSGRDVGTGALATAAEVVEALHDGAQVAAMFSSSNGRLPDRAFVVVAHRDGRQCIAFAEPSSPGRELSDIEGLDVDIDDRERGEHQEPPSAANGFSTGAGRMTFAVSKVRLDDDGRVTGVLWGKVDIRKNDWAIPEVVAPVADVVDALDAGHPVFALFPSVHGHMPDRRFVAVDYDDGRRTIVLAGPTALEREVHDMDRLD
jgi:hypothetical protein